MSDISAQPEKVLFDPCRVRFDLGLQEAFALTQVRSLQEYRLLEQRLRELRGASYFFLNVTGGRARLMITIITAGDLEATSTFALDHSALGIGEVDLMRAGQEDGNYPVSPELEMKIKHSLRQSDWRFFKARQK